MHELAPCESPLTLGTKSLIIGEAKEGEIMEERYGVLREKLDIKILLLFILRRLPGVCSAETLAELVMRDAGVGYLNTLSVWVSWRMRAM